MGKPPQPTLHVTPVPPARMERRCQTYFADFGLDAFGNLQLTFPGGAPAATLTVRLGEKLDQTGAIDRQPPGSVNFREISLTTRPGETAVQLQIPSKPRHSDPKAVHTPSEIGEITVFRYAEIEGAPDGFDAGALRQLRVQAAFDDHASSFESSDETLNAVWHLCKHTMKATTAFGVYIDGERERIPYEADAYINQLSHLACDMNPEVARYTVEHLLAHPTWPTEWSFHMPMMAAADYEMTGDISLADDNFEVLKSKLLMEKAREDGLLRALGIIDWPSGERDGYNSVAGENRPTADGQSGPEINTVVNAFYYHTLGKMAVIARATGRGDEAESLETKASQVYSAFQSTFFDSGRGIYIDGEGSSHASLHANMFPLAFGLVPAGHQDTVAAFLETRGMACSVYGAQYLLEALYVAGRDEYALELMTSRSRRGWWHMLELGSTMTLEAWDAEYKNNLTWNHAWGAAPANIISRFLLGVRPLEPGFKKILIAPQPGKLAWAAGQVPTPHGPVMVHFRNQESFELEIEVPAGTEAQVVLPVKLGLFPNQVWLDGKHTPSVARNGSAVVDNIGPGRHNLSVS